MQFFSHVLGGPCTQLIKNMVISLVGTLTGHSSSFQQIVRNVTADHLTFSVKMNFDEFSEPRTVIVPRCFGVAEGLQNGVGI